MFSQKSFNKRQLVSSVLAIAASVIVVAGFVYGATTIGANISVDGNLTVSGTSATSTFSTGGLTIGTNQFVVQQTSGNVGIGTVSPSALLSLGAGVTAQKLLLFENGAARYGFGIQSGEFRHYIADSATNGFTFGTISAVDGSTWSEKVRITTGGNIGIGTTSPAQLLSVSGNGYLTGGLGVGTTETTAGNITGTGRLSITSTTATSTISTGGLTVGTNQFVVQQTSGNVGIGTTSPAQLLSVAGDAYIAGAGTTTLNLKTTTASKGTCIEMFDSGGAVRRLYINAAGAITVEAGTCK